MYQWELRITFLIGRMVSLRKLELLISDGCTEGFSDLAILSWTVHCRDLEELILSGEAPRGSNRLTYISYCKELTKLFLSRMTLSEVPSRTFTFTKLQVLKLQDCDCEGDTLASLVESCPTLKTLLLICIRGFSSLKIASRTLTNLTVSRYHCDGAVIEPDLIEEIEVVTPALERLQVEDAKSVRVDQSPCLKSVSLYGWTEMEYSLGGCEAIQDFTLVDITSTNLWQWFELGALLRRNSSTLRNLKLDIRFDLQPSLTQINSILSNVEELSMPYPLFSAHEASPAETVAGLSAPNLKKVIVTFERLDVGATDFMKSLLMGCPRLKEFVADTSCLREHCDNSSSFFSALLDIKHDKPQLSLKLTPFPAHFLRPRESQQLV